MTPKQRFLAFAAEHGIEIDHERGRYGGHHLTAYAPKGHQFGGIGIDLMCLWDGEKGNPPDWSWCLRELEAEFPLERSAGNGRL